jgi:hypothetical protein
MRTRHMLLATIALSALTACKGNAPAATEDRSGAQTSATSASPREAKPLEIEWVKEDKFQVKGEPKKYGDVTIFRSNYQVTVHGFPKGTKWAALDKKGVIDSDVYGIIKIIDMTEKIGGVPVDKDKQREAKLDPEATLTLELPTGEKADIKLPPSDLGLSVEEMLKKVENGPVLFGKEPPDEKPMENILFLEGFTPEVFGRASVLRDVDAIAKAERLAEVKGTKKCTGYKDNAGKAASDIELQLKETEVVIFERRTGNVVQKKVFPPSDECPMFTFRRADEKTQESSIPSTAIKSWLKTQVKR